MIVRSRSDTKRARRGLLELITLLVTVLNYSINPLIEPDPAARVIALGSIPFVAFAFCIEALPKRSVMFELKFRVT
jgi:hypothetical protein